MYWVPHDGDTNIITNMPAVGNATPGTSVTTGAASTTKGSVVELISAANNTQDSWGIYIQAALYQLTATASDGAMDILIGGATDDILIPNLLFGYAGDNSSAGLKKWFFPLYIPSGVRIACQAAGLRTSTAFYVGCKLFGGTSPPWRVGRKVTTYGMSGTIPVGTAITPGASGAQGSYAQIVASTTEDHFCLVPSFQVTNDSTMTGKLLKVGIGVGAATEDFYGDWDFETGAAEQMIGPYDTLPRFRDIPSGSRLAMRASNSGTNDAGYNGVIHAVS